MMSALFLVAAHQAVTAPGAQGSPMPAIMMIPEQDMVIVKLILICAVLLLIAVALQGPPAEKRRVDHKSDRRSPR